MKKILLTLILLLSVVTFVSAQDFDWGKFLDGGSVQASRATDVVEDANGDVLIVGYFSGTMDFDPGPAVFNITSTGAQMQQDIYILKLDSAGNFLWAKTMGGDYDDQGRFIQVDAQNNIIISGKFRGVCDFDPGPSVFNLGSTVFSNVFVVKLNSAGNFIWAKEFGVPGTEIEVRELRVDGNSDIFFTGDFKNTVDFDPNAGTSNLTSNGYLDAYVCKLTAQGNLAWAHSFGGTGFEEAKSLRIDNSNNVILIGRFSNTIDCDPGPGVFNLMGASTNSSQHPYIIKLNSQGSFVWAKQYVGLGAGNGIDLSALVINLDNSIVLGGELVGTVDFDLSTAGVFNVTQSASSGSSSSDFYNHKLDSMGNFIWVKSTEGGLFPTKAIYDMDIDVLGNIYTTGLYNGWTDFDPGPDSALLGTGSSSDVFLWKLDAAGDYVAAKRTPINGGVAQPFGLEVGADRSIYTVGYSSSAMDLDPGLSVFNVSPVTGELSFIQKLKPCNGGVDTITVAACDSYLSPSGIYSWATSGTYQDVLTDSLGCDSNITVQLTITTIDTSVVQVQQALFSGTFLASYQWIDCNTNTAIQGATSQTYVPTANGYYAVEVTLNNCVDTSNCHNYILSDVDDLENREVGIYPNPANSFVTIDIGNHGKVLIEVLDTKGRILSSHNFMPQVQKRINIESLSSGVYFLKVSNSNMNQTTKLIKN